MSQNKMNAASSATTQNRTAVFVVLLGTAFLVVFRPNAFVHLLLRTTTAHCRERFCGWSHWWFSFFRNVVPAARILA